MTKTVPSDSAILEDITETIQDLFDDPSYVVAPDLRREDEPRWDSMNHLNLLLALEIRHGVKFTVVEMEKLKSVPQITALLQQKLA